MFKFRNEACLCGVGLDPTYIARCIQFLGLLTLFRNAGTKLLSLTGSISNGRKMYRIDCVQGSRVLVLTFGVIQRIVIKEPVKVKG